MPVSNREELSRALTAELLPLSPGLVYDPVSLGPDPAPLELELDAIQRRLQSAAHRTARLRTTRVVRPRTADMIRALRHGAAAARTARRIVHQPTAPLTRGEIRSLIRRAESVLRDAQIASRRIERTRPFRDRAVPGQPSLFQQQDLPQLERLRDVRARAANTLGRLRDATAPDDTGATSSPVPTFEPPDLTPLRTSGAKDLPALYERWVMLRVVKALGNAGFRGDSIHDALAPTGSEYLADFDSDRAVRFDAGDGHTLVIRFEPWVHPFPLATENAATLYRPGESLHSWRPDLIIHLEHTATPDSPASALAAIVIDAKLGPVIGLEQWQQVRKYHDIRASHDHRSIVRRVCIATPGRLAAAPSDVAREFGIVPDLLALSPLDDHQQETRRELDRLVGFVEEMVRTEMV